MYTIKWFVQQYVVRNRVLPTKIFRAQTSQGRPQRDAVGV